MKFLPIIILSGIVFQLSAQVTVSTSQSSPFMLITPNGVKGKYTGGGGSNVAVGDLSLIFTTGIFNTAVGNNSLYNNRANSGSVAIGYQAMVNADSRTVGITTNNTAVGMNALTGSTTPANNTGTNNTALGANTMLENTSGSFNVAVGVNSLNDNTTGIENVAIGVDALSTNVAKYGNTAVGTRAMKYANSNSTTVYVGNTAFGFEAMRGSTTPANNTGNSNTAIGHNALHNITSGVSNVAIGCSSLPNNDIGTENIAVGSQSLFFNTASSNNVAIGNNALANQDYNNGGVEYSSSNTAIGHHALISNNPTSTSNGIKNTALGAYAGDDLTTGYFNTFIGYNADASVSTVQNSIAIGYNSTVNASNKAVIGNASVTTVGGYGNWSNYSDRRLKENIEYTNRLGLDFILKLKTASYNYIDDQNKRRRDGMIAQDVQGIMKEMGVPFSGLVEDNDAQKTLNLSYSDFVIPLINAIKDQQTQIEKLKKENFAYKNDIEILKSSIVEIKTLMKVETTSNKIGDK